MSTPEIALPEPRPSRATQLLDAMTVPALPSVGVPRPRRGPHRRWQQDPWLVALIICACCASIAASWWSYTNHTILLYGDAHSHLLIARRVLDGLQPGLAQLGDVWLPLPHLIMIPFAWNDLLWRTGLAGTVSSMPCYVAAALYVYHTSRRLTHDGRASFVGALVFVLNPNILYLQTTTLSEPVLFATMAAASYYFIVWAQEDQLRNLTLAALATFLATLARYDGWALFLALLAALVLICWRKHFPAAKTAAYAVIFCILGGIGILLWFLWNLTIFGSPVAFLSGTFSSQAQTRTFINAGLAGTYHNLWQSVRTYSLATAESVGPAIFVLGVLAVIVMLARLRSASSDAIAAYTLLVPFAFYVAAFFLGQDVMYIPYANHPPFYTFYNARFGAEMAAPAAVFVATLVGELAWWSRLAQLGIACIILAQVIATSWGGVISLQDGQVGLSCNISHPIVAYLSQHYNGGQVLIDEYHSQIDLSSADISFSHEIYEGDGTIWANALRNPASYVEWIVIVPHDIISQNINTQSFAFQRAFTLVAQDGPTSAKLWHRAGLPPLPNRPLAGDVVAPYLACNHAKGIPVASGIARPASLAWKIQPAGLPLDAERREISAGIYRNAT